MKKDEIIFTVILFIVFIIIPILRIRGNIIEENKKQEIIKYVYDNKDELLEYINNKNYDDPEELNKFKVNIYHNEEKGYIEFIYFNDSVLTTTKYSGFYYSFNGGYNELSPTFENKLKKKDKGYYYQSGDDSFYTEKIIDNFYYYKLMY